MDILLITLVASFIINMGLFLIAFRYKTDKLTDISYALTFVLLTGFAVVNNPIIEPTRILLFALIAIWASRLGLFLLVRIWKKGVDHRFDDMREHFGRFAKFWALQALSVWVILLPTILALGHDQITTTWPTFAGIGIWAVGLVIEAIADLQKYTFSQNTQNKGKWIETGIWGYSRHPNYFGEILVWVGIYLCVLPTLTSFESWIGLLGPIFITSLLLFISGIPPLEKSANQKWGNDQKYQAYKHRTSILVPWPNGRR